MGTATDRSYSGRSGQRVGAMPGELRDRLDHHRFGEPVASAPGSEAGRGHLLDSPSRTRPSRPPCRSVAEVQGFCITLRWVRLRVLDSALKHGCSIEDISHAIDLAVVEKEIDPDNDPPKILFIGPNHAGSFLEVIGGEMADLLLVWHADACRTKYLRLLPRQGGDS